MNLIKKDTPTQASHTLKVKKINTISVDNFNVKTNKDKTIVDEIIINSKANNIDRIWVHWFKNMYVDIKKIKIIIIIHKLYII